MLTALDESLHHQAPLTFDHVHSTDHRFYDRQLMGGFRPDGEVAFLAGITTFKNMNVIEGFVMVQARSSRQYNVRLTKQYRKHRRDQVDRSCVPSRDRIQKLGRFKSSKNGGRGAPQPVGQHETATGMKQRSGMKHHVIRTNLRQVHGCVITNGSIAHLCMLGGFQPAGCARGVYRENNVVGFGGNVHIRARRGRGSTGCRRRPGRACRRRALRGSGTSRRCGR